MVKKKQTHSLPHDAAVREPVALVQINSDSVEEDLQELTELVKSAGADPVVIFHSSRISPCPKTYIGQGKVNDIALAVSTHSLSLVIFNCALSPSQERNLEKSLCCRVVDRTGLILDIFAQRARTHEGKLQVELAQLQHMSTRLIRGWTHLERQKGGIGLRGPGETQLETDRRLLRDRIKQINKLLSKVKKQRFQSRSARTQSSMPIISLVGYTNAGKSTLFNALSASKIYTADRLFATLDPTVRSISLPLGKKAIISDTVGFIKDLPHELVEAFSATLEEIRESSLILHVVNVDREHKEDIISEVDKVLQSIQASHVPQIIVYNQIDRIGLSPTVKKEGDVAKVWISAKSGSGLDIMKQLVAQMLFGDPVYRTVFLGPHHGKMRARLHESDVVQNEYINEDGWWVISVKMSEKDFFSLENELEAEKST